MNEKFYKKCLIGSSLKYYIKQGDFLSKPFIILEIIKV